MMKRIVCLVLVLGLLMGGAIAEIQATGDANLRKGPGLDYDVVASVKKGTTLEDLDSVIADERGVDWYWVSYRGKECWISSKYAKITSNAFEPQGMQGVQGTGLEMYYGRNLKDAAAELGLTEYEPFAGEVTNRYFRGGLSLLGDDVVVGMSVEDSSYVLFGASVGMPWYEAMSACIDGGLYVLWAEKDVIVFERKSVVRGGMDSCINMYLDENGNVLSMEWATYTSD